ncbi:MAG: hypothetical protein P3W90_005955 [Paracoccus sp. (in: a-proteobacteria)]|nr:hypothetical protein [Paracoccus sp. (in: a-proteobacteria)]
MNAQTPAMIEQEDVLASIRRLIQQDSRPQQTGESQLKGDSPVRLILESTDQIQRPEVPARLHLSAGEDADSLEARLKSLNAQLERSRQSAPSLLERSNAAAERSRAAAERLSRLLAGLPDGKHVQEPVLDSAANPIGQVPAGVDSEALDLTAAAPEPEAAPEAQPVAEGTLTEVESVLCVENAPAPDEMRAQAIAGALRRPSATRPLAPASRFRDSNDADINLHLFAPQDEDLPGGGVLRNLIRDVIRQELHGELGGRFSRNLRNLIRHEIEAALSEEPATAPRIHA